MLTRALLFTLAVGLVASDSSGQLSFDTVPLSSEVPAHDVGRYTNCLVSCALRGAVAPFTGTPACSPAPPIGAQLTAQHIPACCLQLRWC